MQYQHAKDSKEEVQAHISAIFGNATPSKAIFGDKLIVYVNNPHKVAVQGKKEEEEVTLYTIYIETNMEAFGTNRTFTIDKRYKEFKELYNTLATGKFPLPAPFPRKSTFNRFKESVVEKRRDFFDQFLKYVASDPNLRKSRVFLKFLGF